jgi:hypothetical protein
MSFLDISFSSFYRHEHWPGDDRLLFQLPSAWVRRYRAFPGSRIVGRKGGFLAAATIVLDVITRAERVLVAEGSH